MKKRILYIVNPNSGIHKNPHLEEMIVEVSNQYENDFEIHHTVASKHAVEISREAAKMGFDIIVAVGGDGSVNETAHGIIGSEATLGVIPNGSGNGLARHLKLPLDHRKAIELINTGEKQLIDTMKVDERFCIGILGIGFDAHIAHLFAKAGTRGLSTYAKLVFREFYKYKSAYYNVSVDEKVFNKECFLLTIANSSQFGNDAVIAPFADIQDGLLDISIMHRFPLIVAPYLIYKLMSRHIHETKYYERTTGKEIVVKNSGILRGNIDGEAVTFKGDIHVKIMPRSLNVIVPPTTR